MAKTTEAILLSSDSGPTIPWSEIEGVQVTQNKPGTSDILHAVQFGANEVWKVFLNSGWRDIVHNDSGIWKYKDASGLWLTPDDNTELQAIYSAMSVSQNQWGKTEIDAMTQTQWQASGGFGSGDAVGFAMGLVADGTNIPTLEKYTVTHKVGDHDLTLELNSWEASLNDPDEAYCVIDVQDASSGSPWSSGASGGVHRFRHVGVQQSGKAYFWGGINRGQEKLNYVDIYDISGDSWNSGASSAMARDKSAAVIYDNKMYCFGGWSSDSGIVGNLDIYDISGDTWGSGEICPDARCYHTALIYNNKMYCWGGMNPSYDRINTISVYDFATSGWSSGTSGGSARTDHTAVERSGRMYCWGGVLDDSQTTNTLDIYDFATDSWLSGQTGGTPRQGHCAEVIGDKMICFGGKNSSGYLDTVDIYDFKTHSWVTGASLGMDLFCAASFEYSGKMYVWGGMNDQGVFNSMLIYDYSEEFNPQTDVNAWLSINDGFDFQQFPELKVFRRVNDRFYLRGDIYDVSAAGDKRVKLKVGVNDLKNIRIQAVSVGVKYL
jgi:N-acetylneuraminic acid mutarotase